MQMIKKHRWWIVLIVFMSFAFYLSSQTGTETSSTSLFITEAIVKLLKFTGIRFSADDLHMKVRLIAHFVVYIFCGFLLCKAMLTTKFKHNLLLAWGIGCGLGVLDEVHKVLIPGRNCDMIEIFINCGCVTGVCAFMGFCRKMKNTGKRDC